MQEKRLPLPPFGKMLELYQNEAIFLEFPIYLFVGKDAKKEAFQNKRLGVMATYLLPGDSFSNYYWPIKGQKVIVMDTGGPTEIGLKKLCFDVLKTGAITVVKYSEMAPIEIFNQLNLLKDV